MEDFNKNEKQHNFNQIKGVITELNDGEKFCNMTLTVGHENPRSVNLAIKKVAFDAYKEVHKLGDKVLVKFYISSRNKSYNGEKPRWSTMANVLQIDKAD